MYLCMHLPLISCGFCGCGFLVYCPSLHSVALSLLIGGRCRLQFMAFNDFEKHGFCVPQHYSLNTEWLYTYNLKLTIVVILITLYCLLWQDICHICFKGWRRNAYSGAYWNVYAGSSPWKWYRTGRQGSWFIVRPIIV